MCYSFDMAEMKWNLEDWLETRGVTRYELAQNMGGNVKTRLTSLYRMREPKRIDLAVMGEIVSALRHITGEEVTPNDLLEYVPDPEPEANIDAESALWLGDALTPTLEAWEWGPEGEPEGQPVEYVAGEGLYIYEDDAA